MNRIDSRSKYNEFRKEFPVFVFEGFSVIKKNGFLVIEFDFNISEKYFFNPSIKIPERQFYNNNLSDEIINNLVFHIGMIEMVSYWKATCSPTIIIKPYSLNHEQIEWWKKLYYKGLGEFFYLNSIECSCENFVEIIADKGPVLEPFNIETEEVIIVPVGGGKDSVVTLELLSKQYKVKPMIINPRGASLDTTNTAGFLLDDIIEIKRGIDPKLIELNSVGFLNGHTPFSAMLAFVSLLTAAKTGYKHIALSNESSANEATVDNTDVNHQYSKSFEFENDFRFYVEKYITSDINYFSFLRPVNELQITRLFSKFSEYFGVFKSCNVGSKSDTWCCNCPKCLFIYIVLSPFINSKLMIEIFGENLFENEKLRFIFDQLTGIAETKPFECVGTIDEVNGALCVIIDNKNYNYLPALLKYYKNTSKYKSYIRNSELLTGTLNETHFVPDDLLKVLKSHLV